MDAMDYPQFMTDAMGALTQAGMQLEEIGTGYVTAKAQRQAEFMTTHYIVTVWQDGHVDASRERVVRGPERNVTVRGVSIGVAGVSRDDVEFSAKVVNMEQLMVVVAEVRQIRDDGSNSNAAKERQRAVELPAVPG